MNTTESPKRKISALERTIVAGMGSITMPDMIALHKKFPALAIEDIYDILSSIEISALGTTSREFILQYAEIRLLSLRKSKSIEEEIVQIHEKSENNENEIFQVSKYMSGISLPSFFFSGRFGYIAFGRQ